MPTHIGVERGAVAIIVNDRGELLLHLRDDIPGIAWPGYWSVLGGGTDPGESPAAAIARELCEEAGLVANDLIEVSEVVDEKGSGQLITFFAGTWNGNPENLPLSEGVALRFFAPDQLETLAVPGYVREQIEFFLADQGQSGVTRLGEAGLGAPGSGHRLGTDSAP